MALLVREEDVRQAVGMADALETTELALRALGTAEAINQPRRRLIMPGGVLHMLPAMVPELDVFGFKAYSTFAGGARFAVWLYKLSTGELLALIEADLLGRMRTGAASGVATKYLASPGANTVGIYGTGGQAETQLAAVAGVRAVRSVRAYSRNAERCRDFCARMSAALAVEVTPGTPEEVGGQAIVITITTAREPVLRGAWLSEGAHINAAGSNWHHRREIDDEAVRRASLIVADDVEQARIEAGDLIVPIEAGVLGWDRVHALGEVVAGTREGRHSSAEITLFKSLGIGAEDVALAARIHERALATGLGERVRFVS